MRLSSEHGWVLQHDGSDSSFSPVRLQNHDRGFLSHTLIASGFRKAFELSLHGCPGDSPCQADVRPHDSTPVKCFSSMTCRAANAASLGGFDICSGSRGIKLCRSLCSIAAPSSIHQRLAEHTQCAEAHCLRCSAGKLVAMGCFPKENMLLDMT